MDREQINRTKSIKYEPKPIAVREVDESSESTREAAGPAGRPGYLAQQANTATAIAVSPSKGSNDSESESKREVISLPNTEQTELQKIGLTPQRVSVSIGIPSSYFEMIWKKHNPPSEGQEPQTPDQKALDDLRNEETTKIQEYVATLLPVAEGVTSPANLVTVKMFQDVQSAEIPAPGLGENAMAWLGEYWSTLGMIGLAMFSLMMLRSMVRTAPTGPEDEAAAGVLPMHAREGEKETAKQAALKSITRFTGSGPSLRDELSELVQEDPDTAANILRNWIGNVG